MNKKGQNEFMVVLLMGIMFLSGLALLINLPAMIGINLQLGLNNITGVYSAVTIIGVKVIGLALMLLSIYVSWNIIKG